MESPAPAVPIDWQELCVRRLILCTHEEKQQKWRPTIEGIFVEIGNVVVDEFPKVDHLLQLLTNRGFALDRLADEFDVKPRRIHCRQIQKSAVNQLFGLLLRAGKSV